MPPGVLDSLLVDSDFEEYDDFTLESLGELLKDPPPRPGRPKLSCDDAKARKAALEQVRRQNARKVDTAFLRAPRPLAVLKAVNWTKDLVSMSAARADHGSDSEDHGSDDDDDTATEVPSRQEAHLLMAEYCEVNGANMITTGHEKHPTSGIRPETTLFRLRGACASPTCQFHFDWAACGPCWRLEAFTAHTESCYDDEGADPRRDKSSSKVRKTCYSAQELGRFVVASQTESALHKLKPGAVKLLLGSITMSPPSNDLSQRVCAAAMESLRGKPVDNFKVSLRRT